jgi:predicted phage terminase large subunit-like protein
MQSKVAAPAIVTNSSTLSRILAKRRRLTPIQDIEWLTDEQRLEYRKELFTYVDHITKLEAGLDIPDAAKAFYKQRTGTLDADIVMAYIATLYESVEQDYYSKLIPMAQHSLSAYHEYMNFEQFPAVHHDLLIRDLESCVAGRIMTLAFSLSPGTAKSSYGSRSFVQWVLGRDPDLIVLSCGNTARFTEKEFSKPNRDTIATERYRTVFPDVFLKEDSTAVDNWEIEGFKGKYYARSVGASIAGIRSNITILDDPIGNAEIAASATERDKQKRWLFADVLSRRLPNSRLIMIATRWHSDDLIGCVQAAHVKNPESIIGPVKIVNIPAQCVDETVDILGRKAGEYIWRFNKDGTEHYSVQHYESLKQTMPASEWSALYQGVPLDKSGDLIAEEHFTRYDDIPTHKNTSEMDQPLRIKRTFVSVDTAQKGNQRSNFTAFTVWRQLFDNRLFALDASRVKLKMDDIITELERLTTLWNSDFTLLEDTSMGTQIIENYQGKLGVPIMPYNPVTKGSKEFAFEAAVPYIKTGRVLFPKRAPWLTDYLTELIAFPTGQYDDWVDSTSQAILFAQKGGRKLGTVTVGRRL